MVTCRLTMPGPKVPEASVAFMVVVVFPAASAVPESITAGTTSSEGMVNEPPTPTDAGSTGAIVVRAHAAQDTLAMVIAVVFRLNTCQPVVAPERMYRTF